MQTYHIFNTLKGTPEKIFTVTASTRDEAISKFEDTFLINYSRVKDYYKIVKAL